jgi:hypothetical protein
MNFQVLTFFLLVLIIQNSNFVYGQNIEFDLENSSRPLENLRSSSDSKIHPILILWKLSENPTEFAKQNNLLYSEEKIAVYIHLTSIESQLEIPKNIEITAFDQNIISAFVNADQLEHLEELNFVERVTIPDFMQTPPIPKLETIEPTTLVESKEIKTPEENQYDYFLWIVIFLMIIVIGFGIYKIQKKFKTRI